MVNGKHSILARHNFDYSELRKIINVKFGTEKNFAILMELIPTDLSRRFRLSSFTIEEIKKACVLLKIPNEKVHKIFFTPITTKKGE